MRYWLMVLVLIGSALLLKAQVPITNKKTVDTLKNKVDTLANSPYINQGKLAAKRAVKRSLIFAGLGQIYN